MGIVKLAELIRSDAPDAISHKDISDYTGKVIALDTSIIVNQFRAATPSLSPLTGLFFRTLTFLEHDIKPVFVFDGKPPGEKKAVLLKRAEAAGWRSANYSGSASSQTKDCLHLLKLLGVPVIQAPGDAEAFCAQLVRKGTVDAVASEDMDSLPFGADVLIRQFNANKDSEVTEYSLPKLLEKLEITQEEFVDLCILLGCDYCDKISGLGPKRALTLIQKHRTIENVVLHINRQNAGPLYKSPAYLSSVAPLTWLWKSVNGGKKTYPVPLFWKYQEARKLFLNAPQTTIPELVWTEPDEEALVGFLSHVKHVKEDRVRHRMDRFRQTRNYKREEREREKAAGKSKQTRMEDFFRVTRKRGQTVEAADSLSSKKKRPKSK